MYQKICLHEIAKRQNYLKNPSINKIAIEITEQEDGMTITIFLKKLIAETLAVSKVFALSPDEVEIDYSNLLCVEEADLYWVKEKLINTFVKMQPDFFCSPTILHKRVQTYLQFDEGN